MGSREATGDRASGGGSTTDYGSEDQDQIYFTLPYRSLLLGGQGWIWNVFVSKLFFPNGFLSSYFFKRIQLLLATESYVMKLHSSHSKFDRDILVHPFTVKWNLRLT